MYITIYVRSADTCKVVGFILTLAGYAYGTCFSFTRPFVSVSAIAFISYSRTLLTQLFICAALTYPTAVVCGIIEATAQFSLSGYLVIYITNGQI